MRSRLQLKAMPTLPPGGVPARAGTPTPENRPPRGVGLCLAGTPPAEKNFFPEYPPKRSKIKIFEKIGGIFWEIFLESGKLGDLGDFWVPNLGGPWWVGALGPPCRPRGGGVGPARAGTGLVS